MHHLAIVERVTKGHGLPEKYNNHYLIFCIVTVEEFTSGMWDSFLDGWGNRYTITNFQKKIQIINKIDIYDRDMLFPLEMAVLKTFWLNVFKRLWRKKHILIMKRKNPNILFNRSITGKWLN